MSEPPEAPLAGVAPPQGAEREQRWSPAVKLAFGVWAGGLLLFMGFGLWIQIDDASSGPEFVPEAGTIQAVERPPGYENESAGDRLRFVLAEPPRTIEVIPMEADRVREPIRGAFECDGLGTSVRVALRDTDAEVSSTDARFVQLPVGRYCRVDVELDEGGLPLFQRNVAMQSPRGDRMVVCTMGRDDEDGRRQCDAFLRSWRWL